MKKISVVALMLFTALSYSQGIELNGIVSAENNQIKNVANPTDPQDAVTNSYLLELIAELQTQITTLNNFIDNDSDGFTENDGDCDDTDASITTPLVWYVGIDSDADGFFGSTSSLNSCDQPGIGYSTTEQTVDDCNDSDAAIYPGADEIEDEIDNDCDGDIDEGFEDSGTVSDIDGNSYNFITIGNQKWTVDNADMVTYRDGTPIPEVTGQTEWNNLTTGAWCYYNNNPNNPKLYNWYAVAGIHDNDETTPDKELAPEGWHVPSNNEWIDLENYLVDNGFAVDSNATAQDNFIGESMANPTIADYSGDGNFGWDYSTSSGTPGYNPVNTNNSSGFNAIASGCRLDSFYNRYSDAYFWTATGSSLEGYGLWRHLAHSSAHLDRGGSTLYFDRSNGYSVRFVRD